MVVHPARTWSAVASVLHRASDPGSSRPGQPSSPPYCFPMPANHLASKLPWMSAPGCDQLFQALFPASGWHWDRPKSTPVHSADRIGSLEGRLPLGGDSLVRFEPPASATMILKASACLRTSTFGRRSDDRTNTSAHLTAALCCTASPAQALPKRTTQLLKR